jgi:hypothetical protein
MLLIIFIIDFPEEKEIFEEIKYLFEADKKELANIITPFFLLNKNVVESLCYQAQVNMTLLFGIVIHDQVSKHFLMCKKFMRN